MKPDVPQALAWVEGGVEVLPRGCGGAEGPGGTRVRPEVPAGADAGARGPEPEAAAPSPGGGGEEDAPEETHRAAACSLGV